MPNYNDAFEGTIKQHPITVRPRYTISLNAEGAPHFQTANLDLAAELIDQQLGRVSDSSAPRRLNIPGVFCSFFAIVAAKLNGAIYPPSQTDQNIWASARTKSKLIFFNRTKNRTKTT